MRIIRYSSLLFFFILVCFETADAQWQVTYGPSGFGFVRVQCFAKQGSNLFAGTQGDGVWISTDNSAGPWTKVSNGMTGKSVRALLVNGADLFAGTDSGVFKTTDNGSNWTALNNGLTNSNVSSFALIGANLFVSTSGGGVFLSTNNGLEWTTVNNDLTSNYISSLTVVGTNLFAGNGGFGGGVFLSTNNGTNWTLVNNGLAGDYVFALAASGTNLFAASFKAPSAQVYHSTDNGTNWSLANTGLPNVFEFCFAVSGTNVFAGAYSGGVYHTTDNGANWVEVNQGFGTSRTIRTLEVLGEDLFAGFYDGNVFRRPLSQMITSVEVLANIQPTQFSLDQNYPNPFNPTTTIRFSILKEEYVTLKIFDAFGQEVTTLISEELQTGQYEKEWNASSVASGVYYYSMQAGNYNQTKKLILMK
jgi:photosystem II stability/assembly factor-like uncharacterized protein